MKGSNAANYQFTLILDKGNTLNYSKILNNVKHGRSTVAIKETKDKLTITINAKDATALRASANSVLRDLQVIEATDL